MKGSGFLPNEDLEVSLHSDPIVLGFPTADSSGAFTYTAHIPAGATPGAHTIVVRGLESGATAEAPITILAVGAPSTGVRDLANTGTAWVGTGIAIAGGALLLGLAGLLIARRLRFRKEGDA